MNSSSRIRGQVVLFRLFCLCLLLFIPSRSQGQAQLSASFAKARVECVEHDKKAQFQILLSQAPSVPTTVSLLISGTAMPQGIDYEDIPTSFTFAAGEKIKTVDVTIVDDHFPEDPETIDLELVGVQGGQVGSLAEMTILINDDDTAWEPAEINFGAESSQASEDQGQVQLLLNLNHEPGVPAVVSYAVSGTAASGVDFAALPGTLSLAADATEAYIPVTLLNDGKKGPDKSLVLTLTNITGAAHVGPFGKHVMTIVDSGSKDLPILQFVDRESRIMEDGGTAHVKLSLSAPLDKDLAAQYLVGGSAVAGTDFTALSGKLSIPKGQTSAQIDIPVIDNPRLDGARSVELTLFDAPGASLGAIQSHTLYILDDETPEVNFAAVSSTVREDGKKCLVSLVLDKESTASVTVLYDVAGTAKPGVDYQALPAGVTFPAHTTRKDIEITVFDNDKEELDRTIVLTLTFADRVELGDRISHTVTIQDNDKRQDENPLLVSDLSAPNPASSPDVGVDGLGRAHIVWKGSTGSGLSRQYGVYYARVGADGAIDLPARKVRDIGATAALRPRVAVDPDGRAYVIFLAQSPANFLTFLAIQDGRTSGPVSLQLFNSPYWPASQQQYFTPAIDLNPVTRRPFVIAQANLSRANDAQPALTDYWNGVAGLELDRDGNKVGGTFWAPFYSWRIGYNPLDLVTSPDVAVDKFGVVHCAWVSKDPSLGGGIGIGYTHQGAGVNQWVELTTPLTRNVHYTRGGPRLAFSDDGAVNVGWTASDFKNYFWSRLNPSGLLLAPPASQMMDTSATVSYPALAGSEKTTFFVWTDQRDGANQIYYRTQLRRSRSRNLSHSSGEGFDPALARGADGTAACVWADNRTGVQRIYYRSLSGSIAIDATQEYDRFKKELAIAATATDGKLGPVTAQNKNVIFTWKLTDSHEQTLAEGPLHFDDASQKWTGGKVFDEELPPGNFTVDYEISYVSDKGELRQGEASGEIFVEQFFSLGGLVTDRNTGQPIQNARVTIGGLSVMSDVNGNYAFSEVAASAGTILRARHATHARYTVPLTIAPTEKVVVHDIKMDQASALPVVTNVAASVDGIFIQGVDVPNVFTASVDWGAGDPDRVTFAINGKVVAKVNTTSDLAEAPINMNDSALVGTVHLGRNVMTVVARSAQGKESKPYLRNIVVVPQPNPFKGLPFVQVPTFWKSNNPSIEASFKIPPAELSADLLPQIPLLKKIGASLQGALGFKAVLKTGEWELSASLIFGKSKEIDKPKIWIGPVGIEFEIAAKLAGKVGVDQWFEMEKILVNLSLQIKARLWQLYFTDFAPGGASLRAFYVAAEKIGWDIGNTVRLNLYAKLKGEASFPFVLEKLTYDKTEFTVEFGPEVAYEPELGWAKLNVYLGGALYAKCTIRPLTLTEFGGKVYGGIELAFKSMRVYEAKFVFIDQSTKYKPLPPGTPLMEIGGRPYYVLEKNIAPHPVERPDPSQGLNRFVGAESAASSSSVPAGGAPAGLAAPLTPLQAFRALGRPAAKPGFKPLGAATLPLIQNVYTYSEPALAAGGANLMLLYVADGGDKNNAYQFTDIYWTAFDGTNWSTPAAIKADNLGEFAPAVAYDGGGNAVAVWERINDPTLQTPDMDKMAGKLEIVSAFKTPTGAWSAPVALTNNAWLDYSPRLCGPLSDGSLLLAWTENQRNLLVGAGDDGATSNSRVLWRRWTPATKTWSAPQTLVDHLTGNLSMDLAGRGAKAVFAWTRDADGVLSTTQDREVYAATWNGSGWNPPLRVTSDNYADNAVRAAVTSGGKTFLAWQRDGNLVLNAELTTTSLVRMDSNTPGFLGYALTAGPNDNLALVWQEMNQDGTNACYSVYDPATGRWSRDTRLFTDSGLERSFAPAWDAAGNLTVAYNQLALSRTTQTLTMDGGTQVQVPNYPTRGPTSLGILKTALGRDLAFGAGGFTAAAQRMQPGSAVTLTANIVNRGNLSAVSPVVAFYDGAPSAQTEIARTTIPGWLDGADATTITAQWALPAADTAHTLTAVIDPDHLVGETDRTNNTTATLFGGVDLTPVPGRLDPRPDGSCRLTVKIENLGSASAGPSLLALRRQGALAPQATVTVPAVPHGSIVEAALNLPRGTLPAAATAYFTATADDAAAAGDVNRANNAVTFPITNDAAASPVQFVTSVQTLPVPEGSRRGFTLRLSDRPTTDVKAQVLRLSGDADLSVASAASLTLPRDAWTSSVTVLLAAAKDADTLDGQAVFVIRETSANGIDDAFVTALEQDSTGVNAITPRTLAGTTAWTDTTRDYLLSGTVLVPAGATLRIGPGVTVRLAEGAGVPALVVRGTLESTDTLFILETRRDTAPATRVNAVSVEQAGAASFRRCTFLARERRGPFSGDYADWSAALAASGTARLSVLGCSFEALEGTFGSRTPYAIEVEEGVAAQIGRDAVTGAPCGFLSFDTGVQWLAGAGLKIVEPCLVQNCRWDVRLRGAAAARDIDLRNARQALAGPLTLGAGSLLTLNPGTTLQGDAAGSVLTVPAGARLAVNNARLALTSPLLVSGVLEATSSTLDLHTFAHWTDAARRNGIELRDSAAAILNGCNLIATEDNGTGEWSALINQAGHAALTLGGCCFTPGNPAGPFTTCAVRCQGDRELDILNSAFFGNQTALRFDAVPTTRTLLNCAFQGNRLYAVENRTKTSVDARGNWWGAPGGPTHAANPAGHGDRVTDYVIYSNALPAPARVLATLLDPLAGQEPNNLGAASEQPAVALLGLRVTPPGSVLQRLVFHLGHRASAMAWAKIANFRLLLDADGNGRIDPREATRVGGEPVLTGDADNLWVAFSAPIDSPPDSAGGLILLADLGGLAPGDGFTLEVESGASQLAGGTPLLSRVTPVTHVCGGGAILGDSPAGQLTNRLGTAAAQKGVELFAFTLSGAGRQVQSLEFTLGGVAGLAPGDLTSSTLFVDSNGNGRRDAGEPAALTGGVVTITGATGKIRFSSSCAAGQAYLLTADFTGLAAGDRLTLALPPAGIALDSGKATGAAAPATHFVEAALVLGALSPSYLQDVLLPGKKLYADAALTSIFSYGDPIPSGVYKQLYLRTLNSQRDVVSASLITFSVNRRVRVYVAVDDLAGQVPAWLAAWQVEPNRLQTTDAHPGRRLYSRVFNKGTVILGGNRDAAMPTGYQMYTVVIAPDDAASSEAREWSVYE